MLPDPATCQTTISINPEAVDEILVALQRPPLWADRQQTIGLETVDGWLCLLGQARPNLPWTKIDIQKAGVSGPETTIFLDHRAAFP